jgi:Raf kinase inhibitor-like YbhB/YbcL family protein
MNNLNKIHNKNNNSGNKNNSNKNKNNNGKNKNNNSENKNSNSENKNNNNKNNKNNNNKNDKNKNSNNNENKNTNKNTNKNINKNINKNNKGKNLKCGTKIDNKLNLRSSSLVNSFENEFLSHNSKKSPALEWDLHPEAKSYALICCDSDASSHDFLHWAVQYIPPNVTSLPAMNVERKKYIELPDNQGTIIQGKNDFGTCGYAGPEPPEGSGIHHYHFYLYALDIAYDKKNKNNVNKCENKNKIRENIEDHVIGMGYLMVTYEK